MREVLRIGSQETRRTVDVEVPHDADIDALLKSQSLMISPGEPADSAALIRDGKVVATYGWFEDSIPG